MKGHFDGRGIILDSPVPDEIEANTPVEIVFDVSKPASVLSKLADLAEEGGLPPDFAEQHEHYVKGTPRR